MQFSANTALSSTEIDWKQYLKPTSVNDLDECRHIDEFNASIFEYNNSMLPKVNDLFEKMRMPRYKLESAPLYYPTAKKQYDKLIREENFRMLAAVKYLAPHGKLAIRDYELGAGPAMADALAEAEAIAKQSSGQLVDITEAAGMNHKMNCTCDNKWDGKSERCVGQGVRVRWARQSTHHFLQPAVKPEVY
jgi:hypothetical protein